MTHLDWGLLMAAASLILGGLVSGPVWYAAGHRHGREDAGYGDGPKHRKGTPAPGFLPDLPVAGRLPVMDGPAAGESPAPRPAAGPPWAFFGGAQLGLEPGPDEYELLTRPSVFQEAMAAGAAEVEHALYEDEESPTAWTRRQAAEMDEFIRGMVEQSNYFQHVMRSQ